MISNSEIAKQHCFQIKTRLLCGRNNRRHQQAPALKSDCSSHYEDKYKNALDEGDIEEAMNAANQIGDDRLLQQSTGRVVPDTFTHGTSAQRMYWFKKGYQTGDVKQGNTFEAANL